MISNKGTRILNNTVDYLYWTAQQCRTIDELAPVKLALAICGAVRRGSPNPFVDASYQVFGGPLTAYRLHRMKQQFQQVQELRRSIVECSDVDKAVQVRIEAQRSGAVYQMQPAPQTGSNSVRTASRKTARIVKATTG